MYIAIALSAVPIIFIPMDNILISVKHINKCYAAGRMFMPAVVKGLLIFVISYAARTFIKILKQ